MEHLLSTSPAGGGPAEGPDDGERWSPARLGVLLSVAACVVLAGVAGRQDALPAPVPEPQPVRAELALVPDGVTISLSGVLVVPVVLRDRGGGLTVLSAQTYAEPVREDPVTSPPDRVPPGGSRRFVVLLAPDCPLLIGWGLTFRASLAVRVAGGDDEEQLVLQLGQEPDVADVVRGLCGQAGSAGGEREPGAYEGRQVDTALHR